MDTKEAMGLFATKGIDTKSAAKGWLKFAREFGHTTGCQCKRCPWARAVRDGRTLEQLDEWRKNRGM